MKRFAILLFLAGMLLLVFPYVQGHMVDTSIREEAQTVINQLEPEHNTAPERQHPELWASMTAYNEAIWAQRQSGLCDPWAYQQPSFTMGDYGLDEAFGAISIPAIDLEMPLYLGANDNHMAKGTAQLSQTSLPIGGKNTNCVIAGHRGWGGASYFRYITDLEVGDMVTITNPWEVLVYTVTTTKIIAPNDVEEILIQEGRDMLTLLTCHPYASGGKQRYVIYCDRVEEVYVP